MAITSSIVWLDQTDPHEAVVLAGAKMGRLVELRAAGLTVPDGFTVTVQAYRQHCADSCLDAWIDGVLSVLPAEPGDAAVADAAKAIRTAIEAEPVSAAMAAEIDTAYQELCLRCLDINVPTAVRSSAIGEDSADASFAGIFDTYLGVSGSERVIHAVRRCWASLFTDRAVAYRLRRGISHHDMPIAIGVLELVQAKASGVAFSVHPVTGKRDRIVLECSWGWGEAIVQGLVTPDHVEVGKADLRLLRYDVASKKVVSAFDYAAGQVVEIDMPAPLVDRRVLDDEQVQAVVAAVMKVEELYGYPVDVEWVLDRHRRPGEPICVVQTRPVTVVAEATEPTPTGWNPVAMATKYAFGSAKT